MSQLNFHHLRYFWAVAKEGNLTRAARQLHVSQSALSAQIKQLETDLGQPLFQRTGRTLTLTEVAEHLAWGALTPLSGEPVQISLLGISVSNLVDQASLQLELPFEIDEDIAAARFVVDHSIDEVRRKFGRSAVAYGSVALGTHHSVPEEFRELAEKEL